MKLDLTFSILGYGTSCTRKEASISNMTTVILLCLSFCLFGIVHGQPESPTPQQFIPCIEYSHNCYPGIERCYKNQLCSLKTWIVHLIACLFDKLVTDHDNIFHLLHPQRQTAFQFAPCRRFCHSQFGIAYCHNLLPDCERDFSISNCH